MSNSSWLQSGVTDISDEGADAKTDTDARDALMALREEADPSLHDYLDKAIAATVTPARAPWPKGVAITIVERMEAGDYERMAKLAFRVKGKAGGANGAASTDVDPQVFQTNLVLAAVVLRGFKEPLNEDGTPKHGIWVIDGKPIRDVSGMTDRERLDLAMHIPSVVLTFIASEVDRLNEDPLALTKPLRVLKTAAARS